MVVLPAVTPIRLAVNPPVAVTDAIVELLVVQVPLETVSESPTTPATHTELDPEIVPADGAPSTVTGKLAVAEPQLILTV